MELSVIPNKTRKHMSMKICYLDSSADVNNARSIYSSPALRPRKYLADAAWIRIPNERDIMYPLTTVRESSSPIRQQLSITGDDDVPWFGRIHLTPKRRVRSAGRMVVRVRTRFGDRHRDSAQEQVKECRRDRAQRRDRRQGRASSRLGRWGRRVGAGRSWGTSGW
jgi:hypothetical protein